MEILELVDTLRRDGTCKVFPSVGQPVIENPKAIIPPDLREYFARSGGIELFRDKPWGFRISGARDFVPANPVLKGDFYFTNKKAFDQDRSSLWYIIARGIHAPSEVITIDVSEERNG